MKDRGLHGYCEEIHGETKELLDASNNKDFANMQEEVGDVLRECLVICKLAEIDNKFTLKQVLDEAIDKIKRRQPYVLENKKVTKEDAVRIWARS